MTPRIEKTVGGHIVTVRKGNSVLRVGELLPTDKTTSVIGFFKNNSDIWAICSTGEHINVNHVL